MTREEAINILWMYDVSFEPHPAEEVMHAIDMAIEALRQPERKTGRWIPCSERLPEKSGQYYVSGKSKVWICEFLTIHSSTKLLGGWCNDAANPVVQAWMPLPEPYGGEQE